MPEKRSIASHFNPVYSCRKYGVSLWQCPQFLFIVMGLFSIMAIVTVWLIATSKINDPFLVALIVLAAGAFLMVMSFVITNSFERMAEASRMKMEFLGIISHQLRAPLTNLRFSLDLLASEQFKEQKNDQEDYMAILRENTKRMSEMIDRLLTISRLESGSLPLQRQTVSLEEVTRGIVAKNKPLAEASHVELMVDIKPNLPKVSGDPFWLEQVVGNLVDNAVRYSHGGSRVEINLQPKRDKILFTIQDHGVGIPQDEQKFVFEKFFRSESAFKKQTDGSGLGLHIVKKFVQALGGHIWFKSIEGKGTTFYFTLPAVK